MLRAALEVSVVVIACPATWSGEGMSLLLRNATTIKLNPERLPLEIARFDGRIN